MCTGLLLTITVIMFGCQNDGGNSGIMGNNAIDLDTDLTATEDSPYEVGAGIANVTGPPGEVMFGGYCNFAQTGQGLYMRQRSRAFIIKDTRNNKSIVLATADVPMLSTGVYVHVIKKLKEKYNDLYTEKNIILSATHTHSGPGGFFKTFALNLFVGLTFNEDNFNTIVNGIYNSIVRAHESLAPGRVFINSGKFSAEENPTSEFSTSYRINRQRSKEAYELNRDADQYLLPNGKLDDTNRELTQLKFIRGDGKVVGIYHFAPVHPNVSGNYRNLINGDINGYTSYLFESQADSDESKHGDDYLKNQNLIVAFAQNDCADTSSNLPEDAKLSQFANNPNVSSNDPDSGEYQNKNVGEDRWIADGSYDYERLKLRGKTLYVLTKQLFEGDGVELTGEIDYRQMFAAAQSFKIDPAFIDEKDIYYENELDEDIDNCRLCNGAAGSGFLAGSTEDGDSGLIKDEGCTRDVEDYRIIRLNELTSDPLPSFFNLIMAVLVPKEKRYAEMDCQMEKQIAISFDELNALVPNGKVWNMNQPFQIVKIGNFAIIAVPFEVTTMSGRRLKAELKGVLSDVDHAVISATSNSDMRYLTTREEYGSQQYEGGATLMGPYSLNAVRQLVYELADSFNTNAVPVPEYNVDFATVEKGLETYAIFDKTGVVLFDDKPLFKQFGTVKDQPNSAYNRGDKAYAVFWGAHPNNNLTVGASDSYLVIEKQNGGSWDAVAFDRDPNTKYMWKRNGVSYSHVSIIWNIPEETDPGNYRIRHIGYWKSGWTRKISKYEGVTNSFTVN